MSYGPDAVDQFRRAASYVDRILKKSEKPGDLPVQAPTKYELIVNLKTAKTAGFTLPAALLARRRGDRIGGNVRLWPIADIQNALTNVRFRG
jgi:ABC-type uncharacterized transport system substrate-binding protein